MTDEEADALGARLAACKHFRPMAGLRDMQGRTWEQSLLWRWAPSVDRPDIREPATKGIVMALIRDAWDGELLGVAFDYDAGEWVVRLWNGSSLREGFGDTEEEALVRALENAPA